MNSRSCRSIFYAKSGAWKLFRCFCFLLFLLATIPAQASALGDRLSGRVLISVEEHGEAWYIDPLTSTRSYLGRPEEALRFWHTKALGIKNSDLDGIPAAQEASLGNLALRRRLSGRILLQVESHGEAWYVNPADLKKYRLQSPEDARFIMEKLGLGITVSNLASIPSDQIKPAVTVLQNPPFISQAPLGEWSDPRQADGCEEASVLMALAWVRGEGLPAEEARNKIISMSDWEETRFGYFRDTSAKDTADRLLRSYAGFENYSVEDDIDANDIKNVLMQGKIAIVPINGTLLGNPYYSNGGPLRHMILMVGYDANRDEFILHDPGTRYGAFIRFSGTRIQNALQDYNSGDQVPVGPSRTAMIVISKSS